MIDKKNESVVSQLAQLKSQSEEIQLKNKRLEEERNKLEHKRKDLEKEANYLGMFINIEKEGVVLLSPN
jgi:hypothetical protein